MTEEWTPLEPGVIDHKYYVRGVGEVSEATFKGPLETSKLVWSTTAEPFSHPAEDDSGRQP